MPTNNLFYAITITALLLSGYTHAQNTPNANSQPVIGTAPSAIFHDYSAGVKVNYVRSIILKEPLTDENYISPTAKTQTSVSTQYTDGLGRPLQNVNHFASPLGNDVVDLIQYDEFGRETTQFLPYTKQEASTADNGKFKLSPYQEQRDFYNNTLGYTDEIYLYNRTVFEASPLNRPEKTMAAGAPWVGSETGSTVTQNPHPHTDIPLYIIAYPTGSLPLVDGRYDANELMVQSHTDEDGKTSTQYTDKQGKVILMEQSKTKYPGVLQTFYVHDNRGLLRVIIPPKAVTAMANNGGTVTQALVDELCFYYEYDGAERQISKQTPGGGKTLLVYNTNNRPILTQTSTQKEKNSWVFYKYDVLGRPIKSGLFTTSFSQAELQAQADDPANASDKFMKYLVNNSHYGNQHLNDFISAKLYLTYYYDDYTFTDRTYDALAMNNLPQGFNSILSLETTSLLTGTKVALLDGKGTQLLSVNYYNDRNLLIQTQSQNHLEGWNTVTHSYDFSGNKLGTYTELNNPKASNNQQLTLFEILNYDHVGRLLNIYHSINKQQPVMIQRNQYDEAGRVSSTYFNNATEPALTYTYNIRNWLTSINKNYCLTNEGDKFFGMELSYDHGYQTNYLSGNLAGIKWRNAGKGNELRSYGYKYDNYNRLHAADFVLTNGIQSPNSFWGNTTKDYTAKDINYDENGNLITMTQMGLNPAGQKIILDELLYQYYPNSNKLQSVTEQQASQSKNPKDYDNLGDFRDVNTTTDYTYDNSGNLKRDANKSLSFTYDAFINKTREISRAGQDGGTVTYLYDALGNKLQKRVLTTKKAKKIPFPLPVINTTDYLGAAVYTTIDDNATPKNNTNGLAFVSHAQGRIRYENKPTEKYSYDYFLKDHLGSTRAVITYDVRGAISKDSTPQAETKYIATSEPTNAAAENQLFDNIETTRSPLKKATTTTDKFTAKLSARNSKTMLGPDITLKVMAGDSVKISAEALYETEENNNPQQVANHVIKNFINAFTSVPNAAGEAARNLANSHGKQLANAILHLQQNNTLNENPNAFLNYVLYDEYMNLIPQGSGAIQVKNTTEWQTLQTDKLQIPQNGFLRVFSSNMENAAVNINNTTVAVVKGKLLEEFNYYPYGLVFDQTQQITTPFKKTNYLYNGKELQHNEFGSGNGLELNDYHARLQDPQLGRWWQIDELSEKFSNVSSYNYCLNNPTNTIDFDGRDIIVLNAPQAVGGLGHAAVLIGNDKDGWYLYSKNGTFGSSGIQEQSSGPSNKFPDQAIYFKSLNQFANSEKNFNLSENGEIEYSGAFRITTDIDTDIRMAKAALISVNSYYNVATNSCIDVCSDALEGGGLNGGTEKRHTSQTGESYQYKSSVPNTRYGAIKQNNKGVDVSKSIMPSNDTQKKMRDNSVNGRKILEEAEQKTAEQNMPANTAEEFTGG